MMSLFLFATIGCEDDPLLAPSNQEEDKGSYAATSLPNTSQDEISRDNPTIF